MKTTEQIIQHMNDTKKDDQFGFQAEVLARYLTASDVQPFCKPDADLSGWKQSPLDRESVIAEMRSYMEFAWDKALDHRGISASRSVEKMRTWLWLLEDDELVAVCDDETKFAQYGAPVLAAICRKYGFPIPAGEEAERIARGVPCSDYCESGCGQ